jgi:hypothetical protein
MSSHVSKNRIFFNINDTIVEIMKPVSHYLNTIRNQIIRKKDDKKLSYITVRNYKKGGNKNKSLYGKKKSK